MSEPDQVVQFAMRVSDEHVLALAWNIATEPKIYRELVSNPYSVASLQYIAERFPDEKSDDVIQAVALAEPEGIYDWNFRQLSGTEQTSETARQMELFTKMRERLLLYAHTYTSEFARMPREFVYASLSIVVFESTDGKLIEQMFAQAVRRDLRLLIFQSIEGIRLSMVMPRPQSAPDNRIDISHPVIRTPLQRLGVFSVALSVLVMLFFFPFLREAYGGLVKRQQPSDTAGVSFQESAVLGSEVQRSVAAPVRLKIPKITVDAVVQYVASTSEGTMGVPDNTADVGWYKFGPRPGEEGSAVVAGHLNGTDGGAGVFVDLYKLTRGDILSIEDDHGGITNFVVRESRIYDPGYAEEVFSKNDGKYLNLITCDGLWDDEKEDYSKRLVVFADLAN